MLNSPLLDVAIGLIFIFLLYSLLATSIQEMIAMILSLRGRMLRNAVAERMLTQTKEDHRLLSLLKGIWSFLEEIIRIFIGKKKITESEKKIGDQFFDHPLIKKYGSSRIFPLPSYIPTHNFSFVLKELLVKEFDKRVNEISFQQFNQPVNTESTTAIQQRLLLQSDMAKIKDVLTYYASYFNSGNQPASPILDKEIWQILQGHLKESKGQADAFTAQLEQWFDDTMNRVSGWYKRQTQTVLLILGLCIAVLYNVDAVGIANRLSVDKDAREKLVLLATETVDTTKGGSKKQEMLDSMSARLDDEMKRMHNIIALGWGDYGKKKDSVVVLKKFYTAKCGSCPGYASIMQDTARNSVILDSLYEAKPKWFRTKYAIRESLQTRKLLGLLVTAFAICLGAPFWFDLLSRVVKLRSSGVKEGDKTPSGKSTPAPQHITIVNSPNKDADAVG